MQQRLVLTGTLIGALWFIAPLDHASGQASWGQVRANPDELTGNVSHYSVSGPAATVRFSFPYDNVRGYIYAVCESNESPYIGLTFSRSPNLVNDQTESGYSVSRNRISIDGNVERYRFTQQWGSRNIFSTDQRLVARIKSGVLMRLELDWYGEGKVIFSFPLTGSSKAISALDSKCKSASPG